MNSQPASAHTSLVQKDLNVHDALHCIHTVYIIIHNRVPVCTGRVYMPGLPQGGEDAPFSLMVRKMWMQFFTGQAW